MPRDRVQMFTTIMLSNSTVRNTGKALVNFKINSPWERYWLPQVIYKKEGKKPFDCFFSVGN